MSEKIFAMHISRRPRTGFSKALGNEMSVYSCKSCQENFCSRGVGSFYLVGKVEEGGRGRLSDSLKATRCLVLIKCFKTFHFN